MSMWFNIVTQYGFEHTIHTWYNYESRYTTYVTLYNIFWGGRQCHLGFGLSREFVQMMTHYMTIEIHTHVMELNDSSLGYITFTEYVSTSFDILIDIEDGYPHTVTYNISILSL